MKLYIFVNRYLSGVQAGIQAAHAVAELMLKARRNRMVSEWAMIDKTIVLLNGGDSAQMRETWAHVNEINLDRTAAFIEPGLGDLMTAIAFLPDHGEQELIDNHRKGIYADSDVPVLTPTYSPILYKIATGRTIS